MKVLALALLAAVAAKEQTVEQVEEVIESADVGESTDDLAEQIATATDGAVTQEQLVNALSDIDSADFGALAVENLDLEALQGAEGFTLFLPNDEAFKTFFAEAGEVDAIDVGKVLAYHVSASYVDPTGLEGSVKVETLLTSTGLEGPRLSIVTAGEEGVSISYGLGSANVIDTVVVADGVAIIHVLDAVLQLPISPSETATTAELTSLVDAVVAADLVEAIDTTPRLTIFAPTNEAFEAAGDVDADALAGVLTYHVVPEAVGLSFELESGELTTLAGTTLSVEVSDSGVTVNGASVVLADVLTENGVVHVIDAVLNPADGGEPSEEEEPEIVEGSASKAILSSSVAIFAAAAMLL